MLSFLLKLLKYFFPAQSLPDNNEVVDSPKPKKYQPSYTWILDPGHGKLTNGKRSPILPDGRQLLEYEYNGDICERISKKLTKIGVSHILTYDKTEQKNIGNNLEERVDIANKLKSEYPKIFVSVHGNAGPVRNPKKDWSRLFKGVEVFYFPGSKKGKHIASIFQKHIVKRTMLKDRGIKSARFHVLKNTKMSAILTENAFFNNPDEVLLMLSNDFREEVAQAHVDAIMQIEKEKLI